MKEEEKKNQIKTLNETMNSFSSTFYYFYFFFFFVDFVHHSIVFDRARATVILIDFFSRRVCLTLRFIRSLHFIFHTFQQNIL